ncbi:tigger transposable element-derived protein 1-like [Stegodyphus dumicola]|uniref:tigger transposable element-derived protein 1-like n=1 Tax=Stegodyphus dumicola TaxID=202533 RepID=UPI0015ACBBCD|nr:tigger transposable element-derived protein 1-like [Stegodyphus dumicola]
MAHKDRVAVIKASNTTGFMLKPGLIYKAKNPRALKNRNTAVLIVFWMHNSKAWITKALTLEWILHCFIPQLKLYLAEKGLPFKVLLLMDCAGGHATDLQYDGVQIEFLPPNTTSLINLSRWIKVSFVPLRHSTLAPRWRASSRQLTMPMTN